jgi:hypothetical protein
MIGSLSSRLDRFAMHSDRIGAVRFGRSLAEVVTIVLYFGGPIATAIAIAFAADRLGLP